MTASLSRDDCDQIVTILTETVADLPEAARSLRAKVRTMRDEHFRAVKMYDRADEDAANPEIRPAGAIESGESIQLARVHRVRRVTETGIEIMDDGRWVWENISSRTTPLVVVDGIER